MSVFFAHSVYHFSNLTSTSSALPPNDVAKLPPIPKSPSSLNFAPDQPSTTTPPPKPIHIAIIGAGVSGLALAIRLLKYPHIKITIYEAAPAFEEIGAGVGFGRNATNAMKLIDPRIYEGFLKIATGKWEWFNFYWV
jgi:hypothetical protein